jgi:hypothetical protein
VAFVITPNNRYRIREVSAPSGFIAPDGFWFVHWNNTTGGFVITHDPENPAFASVRVPCDHCPNCEDGVHDACEYYTYVLHLPNMPMLRFIFRKTNHHLYNEQNWHDDDWWEEILLAGAHFSLYAWHGPPDTPPDDLVGSGNICEAPIPTPGHWRLIWYGVSTSDPNVPFVVCPTTGDPAEIYLDPRFTYFRLVETQPPPACPVNAPNGFDLPWGQWQLSLREAPDALAPANSYRPLGDDHYLRIRAVGDQSIPAFVIRPDTDIRYVGNRPTLELPLSGGVGRSPFTFAGFTLLLLALGAMTYQVRRNKLALADGECAGSCADCAHGTKLGTTKVFCLRRGVMPIDGGCSRYAPAETSDEEPPSPL